MNQNYEKLKTLLKVLFQLDQPDLDFGLYRIMHAKSAEVSQFLDKDLLPQVRAAFAGYQPADKAAIERELAKAIEQARALGADPEALPKVKELRAKLADDAVDLGALEAGVYDHLYSFFRRYYSEGDFLSRRVYKPGVYAIPYEGEEVKLHWANADQYYIKTSEYLRDYAFRLRPEDEKKAMRVHFRLVDAAEGPHGNVKEQAGKERRFKLAPEPFATLEGDELVIRFTYEPDAADQKELNALAEAAILGLADASLADWAKALGAKHVRADGTAAEATRLRVHLDRYTARNTFDYFIHKDLDGFLRRELDFYVKNEVMHLDDVESETAPRVEQLLSSIKIIRSIAGKVIDFLAHLENFQKKLWLKKKLVVGTSWCVRIGCVPSALLAEVAVNREQHQEWVAQIGIDRLDGYSTPLSTDFLLAQPTLMLDTRHFNEDFAHRLVAAFDNLDDATDCVLVHSENFQALALLQASLRERVDCVYIDPPYNSDTTAILYKNDYRHSSWLSLMQDRLLLSRPLTTSAGSHIVAIDENEQEVLGRLLAQCFNDHVRTCVSLVHNKKGIQGRHFSYSHEFAYFALPPGLEEINGIAVPESEWVYSNLRKGGRESERSTAKNCFYPIIVQGDRIVGFGDVCSADFHPPGPNVQDGDRILVYPVDPGGVERKWRYARESVPRISRLLKVARVRSGEVQIHKAVDIAPIKTVWDDPRYSAGSNGTRWLSDLGVKVSDDLYPKSLYTVTDCIRAVSGVNARVLDYFAGSGTTGHAVVVLNREDGGRRKVLLVEMGEHFDSVLVPRMKKITFGPEWGDGQPLRSATREEAERSPRIMKVLRLEAYEDSLNNLKMRRTQEQQGLLDLASAQGADRLKEQYMLRYLLDVETRGSQSLLNVAAFTDPTAYKLKVKGPGSDESREVNVDLLETFNLLIGLTVEHLAAPQTFSAETQRDGEGRLRLKDRLRQEDDGRWWFRKVTGTTPDGRKALVIWRRRPGGETAEGIEQDNLVLDEWFTKQGYSSKDSEFDLIYVNGDNNLENLKAPDDTWKVRLIETDLLRLMFETEGM